MIYSNKGAVIQYTTEVNSAWFYGHRSSALVALNKGVERAKKGVQFVANANAKESKVGMCHSLDVVVWLSSSGEVGVTAIGYHFVPDILYIEGREPSASESDSNLFFQCGQGRRMIIDTPEQAMLMLSVMVGRKRPRDSEIEELVWQATKHKKSSLESFWRSFRLWLCRC